MQRLSRLCLIAVTALFAAMPLSAQNNSSVSVGVRTGLYFDPTDLMIGGELLVPLTSALYLNPNIEYVFADYATVAAFNLDAHYDLPIGGDPFIWFGAGIGLLYADPEGPVDGDINAGLDILFGVGFDAGPIIPYSQLKVFVGDGSQLSLAFGLRF